MVAYGLMDIATAEEEEAWSFPPRYSIFLSLRMTDLAVAFKHVYYSNYYGNAEETFFGTKTSVAWRQRSCLSPATTTGAIHK